MTIPTRAEFFLNLQNIVAPADTRCTICLEQLTDAEPVVDTEHTTNRHCYFHRACILTWIETPSTNPGDVIQRTHSTCPNDREPLYSDDRETQMSRAEFIAAASAEWITRIQQMRQDDWNPISSYREHFARIGVLRQYYIVLLDHANPEYKARGQELRNAVVQWDIEFANAAIEQLPHDIRTLKQKVGKFPHVESNAAVAVELAEDVVDFTNAIMVGRVWSGAAIQRDIDYPFTARPSPTMIEHIIKAWDRVERELRKYANAVEVA